LDKNGNGQVPPTTILRQIDTKSSQELSSIFFSENYRKYQELAERLRIEQARITSNYTSISSKPPK
jgi:hypothetical protein